MSCSPLAPEVRRLAYECFEADRIGLLRLHVRVDERTAGVLGARARQGLRCASCRTDSRLARRRPTCTQQCSKPGMPTCRSLRSPPAARARWSTRALTRLPTKISSSAGMCALIVGLTDEILDHRTWRFEVARIMIAAAGVRTRMPGPAQLNVEFSEPLMPAEFAWPPPAPELVITATDTVSEARTLPDGAQTVIVAGDCPPELGATVADLAVRAGVPLMAEPSSNARRGEAALSTYRLLLSSTLAEGSSVSWCSGRPTLSRPVSRLLARDDLELVVVSAHADWIDPGRSASLVTDAVRLPDAEEW